MSFAPKYTNKSKLLKSVVGLLKNKNIFHEEKINIIPSLIQIEIDNFLNEGERKEFEGAIEMTSETEEIIMRRLVKCAGNLNSRLLRMLRKEDGMKVEKKVEKKVKRKSLKI